MKAVTTLKKVISQPIRMTSVVLELSFINGKIFTHIVNLDKTEISYPPVTRALEMNKLIKCTFTLCKTVAKVVLSPTLTNHVYQS